MNGLTRSATALGTRLGAPIPVLAGSLPRPFARLERVRRIRARRRQGARVVASALAALALVAGGRAWADAAGYRINTSASVPMGLWQLDPGAPVVRGAIVLWCPPDVPVFRRARELDVVPHGRCPGGYAPLLKPVAALPGDVVTVTAGGIVVNGRPIANSAARSADRAGRPLPRLAPGTHRVAPGEVWVVSSHSARSLDSRYFGPVGRRQVTGVLRPVALVGDGR